MAIPQIKILLSIKEWMELPLQGNHCLTVPALSDKLTTTCEPPQTHISAVPVYTCQSVATSLLQLMICTVGEKLVTGRELIAKLV